VSILVIDLKTILKAVVICMALAFVSIGDAEAKKSDKCSAKGQPPCPVYYPGPICDSGLGDIGGKCTPCGKEGQRSCPPMERGRQCEKGLDKVNGYCRSQCGGPNQKACPKIKAGYPCRGKYEPNANNICTPCGGANQKACRALKSGEQCNRGLDKDDRGICRPCGGVGEPACGVLKEGTICKPGTGKINGLCQPCGKSGQPACPALEQGRQCEAWTTERNGVCTACGTPETGACRVTDQGRACQDLYSFSFGACKETIRSLTRQKAIEKFKELGPDVILGALSAAESVDNSPSVKSAIKSGDEPASLPDNKACAGDEHRAWTIGVGASAGAGIGVEGEVGAAFRCAEHRKGQKDMKWYSGGAWSINAGGSVGGGVNVGMWMADFNNLRGKSHGMVFSLVDIVSAAMKTPPPSYKGVSPDVSIGFFFEDDDSGRPGPYQGFTVGVGGSAGFNLGRYVNATTVQYCDYDMDCALFNWREEDRTNGLKIAVKERDKEGITVDIFAPGEDPRTDVYFERDTITDKRDYRIGSGGDAERICFRHNFKELKYLERGRNCDRGVSLKVEGALDEIEPGATSERSFRPDAPPPAVASAINTLGLWEFQAKGQTVTDEFIQQTDDYIILRRYGTTQKRRYDKVGENAYRNERGATFRFVSDKRGIWVSPDGETVYQLQKR
jgi:hypothetical protein